MSAVHICYYSNCLIRTSSITLHSCNIWLHLLPVSLSLSLSPPACLCVSFSLLLCFCPSLYPRPPNLPSHTLCLTHLLSARQVSVAKRQAMSDGLLFWERRLSIMISHPPVPYAHARRPRLGGVVGRILTRERSVRLNCGRLCFWCFYWTQYSLNTLNLNFRNVTL